MSTMTGCVAASAPSLISWAGVDVSKKTFDAALWLPLVKEQVWPLKSLPYRRFERTIEGAAQFVAWLEEKAVGRDEHGGLLARAVMEATGSFSEELARWLRQLRPELAPAIVNPRHTRAFIESLAQRNKTDAVDARALARYGFERRPEPSEVLSESQQELRELVRLREDLVGVRVAEENRAQEPTHTRLARDIRRRHVEYLKKQIVKVELEIQRVIAQDEQLHHDAVLLDGIYGVGIITVAVVLAELGDLRRFEKARQLTAFAGLSPQRRESGSSVRGRTRLSKQGPSRLRACLYMCAMSAIGGDNDLARLYRRLIENGKTKMAALGAVMRKLLTVMRAILISEQNYHRHHQYACGKPCGETVESLT